MQNVNTEYMINI